jgi:hypothetical protein
MALKGGILGFFVKRRLSRLISATKSLPVKEQVNAVFVWT